MSSEKVLNPAESLAGRLLRVRARTVAICAPLLPEDTVVQPMADVSPPKWHLAHTTWFFETFVLKPQLSGYREFDPQYGYLFNSYYNHLGTRVIRDQRGTVTRPGLADVLAYRAYVDAALRQFLTDTDAVPADLWPIIELGIQHEEQHQELLLTDIKYILGTNPLAPAYLPAGGAAPASTTAVATTATALLHQFLPVPGGLHPIGFTGAGFCFDNEQPRHQVWLDAFEIGNRPVTNAEFAAFIAAGGYGDFRHWLADGWDAVQRLGWEAPLYWVRTEGGEGWLRFRLRGGLLPLEPHAPVTHLSFYEADAYARWAGARLPTEAEWETACAHFNPAADPTGGTFQEDGEALDPRPVPADADPTTAHQLLGDVWEWTYSAYHAYPGFRAGPGALGEYNGKFMVSQLVLRGGSCATPRAHIRPTYRNFFPPDKRWQFSGLRLAR